MKRQSYLNHNSRNDAHRFIAWVVGTTVVVVLIAIVRFVFPNTLFSAARPLWTLGNYWSAQISSLTAGFDSNRKLAAENDSLAAENAILKNENAVLTARAQDLTKLLGGTMSTSQSTDRMPVGVLAHPPESPYDTLVIDAGSNDGIKVGALVYAQGGVPIGTIKHVTSDTAQVSLYTSPGRSIAGWIGANRLALTLTGAGSGAFTAILSQSAPVSVGDMVYAPGPGALPIGTLVKITSDPSSPSEILQIQPYANLFSITWVEVDKSSS